MMRVLLVDDSPHAQRMGERILSEEGYEVVAVSNADSALIRLEDVDPDVVLADAVMPGRNGYEICQFLKMNPRSRRVRVILTAGAQEPFDQERATQVGADGVLKKPFEASVLLALVNSLAELAVRDRELAPRRAGNIAAAAPAVAPFVAVVDDEQVRAAVTVALDAAMETMAAEISRRVIEALKIKPGAETAPVTSLDPPGPAALSVEGKTAAEAPPEVRQADRPEMPGAERVRRVTPLRHRSTSILGLDAEPSEPEIPDL